MASEARLVPTENGLLPEGEGWYVVNARDAQWWHNEKFGASCNFEGDERFADLGVNLVVLQPGQPNTMYHAEDAQEDFLVLSGECLLIVDREERPLKAWDFVHSPPWTDHVLVGTGDRPCTILMVGSRKTKGDVHYMMEPVAKKHHAGVEIRNTFIPEEAFDGTPEWEEGPAPDGLPG
jgi:uncharacterized cupin superfamily protein